MKSQIFFYVSAAIKQKSLNWMARKHWRKPKGAIKNGQFRDIDNIGITTKNEDKQIQIQHNMTNTDPTQTRANLGAREG